MGQVFSPREGATPEEVTDLFLRIWRSILVRSHFKAGCAVVAVTVAADSPELLEHASAIFRAWRGRLSRLLIAAGAAQGDAAQFAAVLIAASEGAVVLSRGEQSLEPFDLVASQLLQQARALMRTHRSRAAATVPRGGATSRLASLKTTRSCDRVLAQTHHTCPRRSERATSCSLRLQLWK